MDMQKQHPDHNAPAATRVVLVGGGPEVLEYAEPLLPRGMYEVDFVETYEGPYGAIRAQRPDLIVLCLRIEDEDGFQLLSMLRLDPATRSIPVLTYTTEFEGQPFEGVDEGERTGHGVTISAGPLLARH
jgi:CheY-like chemotaxis protein